ncbi:MAG: hypothetical protein M3319_15780 [Actinomycetota bacterium]|nr:hypothetical protein [Actinomycetota bacterium]
MLVEWCVGLDVHMDAVMRSFDVLTELTSGKPGSRQQSEQSLVSSTTIRRAATFVRFDSP